jgi:hypothetical protein
VIAIGVVVVAKLFGLVGLLVAMPILLLVTIAVEELWVKPLEAAGRARAGPEVLELRDGDDRAGEHEDHDQDLQPDPEAGKLHRSSF